MKKNGNGIRAMKKKAQLITSEDREEYGLQLVRQKKNFNSERGGCADFQSLIFLSMKANFFFFTETKLKTSFSLLMCGSVQRAEISELSKPEMCLYLRTTFF